MNDAGEHGAATTATQPGPSGRPVRDVDCAIVGGGPAGLSAAVNLSRMRRTVLVIDDRDGRSLWSQVNRNYLGFPDGIAAAEIRLQGRRQAARYGSQFLLGRVTAADRDGSDAADVDGQDGRFVLLVEGDMERGAGTEFNVARDEELGRSLGEVRAGGSMEVRARTVILATGVRDPFPRFPGRDECVGRSLFWCITCDGYETIGHSVAVVGHDEEAVEMALDLLDFTPNVTIVAGRKGGFTVPELEAGGSFAPTASLPTHMAGRRIRRMRTAGSRPSSWTIPKKTRLPVEVVFYLAYSYGRETKSDCQLGVEAERAGPDRRRYGAAHQRAGRVCRRRRDQRPRPSGECRRPRGQPGRLRRQLPPLPACAAGAGQGRVLTAPKTPGAGLAETRTGRE
jgi:thioredoxin reductase